MTFSKIGFHGAGTGIGDYMARLDAAGIPFHVKSIANGGYAAQAAKLARASGIKHSIIIRWPEPYGRGNDHPYLHLEPEAAARELYGFIKNQLDTTPEIHEFKDLIRVEPTNEISTKDNDPSWIGFCLVELGRLLNADGWAAALGGFNNGQPEKDQWRAPGMFQLLLYLSDNRQNTLTVHEGKTTIDDMKIHPSELWPFLIGRYTWILEAARELGIPNMPRIEISEWGWKYNDMPGYDLAMRDVRWLAETTAKEPALEAVYLWNLYKGGGEWGDLPNKMIGLIPLVTDYSLSIEFPDPEPGPDPAPEPPPEPTEPPEVNYKVVVNLLPQDASKEEKKKVIDKLHEKKETEKETITQSADDAARLVASGLPGSKAKVWWPQRWAGDISAWLLARGVDLVELHPKDAIPSLGLTVPMSGQFTILKGGRFNAYRDYSHRPEVKQLHEGLDFSKVGSQESLVLASKAGRVIFIGYSPHGYGNYVKIQHYEPLQFETYYGHMERVDVEVGQAVKQKEPLGVVGSTGNSSGPHVHLTVKVPGYGLKGYIVDDVVDPYPHFLSLAEIPTPEPPPPPPSNGATLIGLHATADPVLGAGELDVFSLARPEAVKILSNIDPVDLRALIGRLGDVEVIIRTYLSMWEDNRPRTRTPAQFLNDTISDVRRCLDVLKTEDVLIELHNEPNLSLEGLGGSWDNGLTFSYWFNELLRLYREQLPRARYMFPGLSPGPRIQGLRADKFGFWELAGSSLKAADAIGDHAYWGVLETVHEALAQVDQSLAWLRSKGITKPVWITEASDKSTDPGPTKGQRYVTFYQGLEQRPQVKGVTYFVASATHPDFQREVWVKGGKSTGIAEEVGKIFRF